jgi:hypothetical protein
MRNTQALQIRVLRLRIDLCEFATPLRMLS